MDWVSATAIHSMMIPVISDRKDEKTDGGVILARKTLVFEPALHVQKHRRGITNHQQVLLSPAPVLV